MAEFIDNLTPDPYLYLANQASREMDWKFARSGIPDGNSPDRDVVAQLDELLLVSDSTPDTTTTAEVNPEGARRRLMLPGILQFTHQFNRVNAIIDVSPKTMPYDKPDDILVLKRSNRIVFAEEDGLQQAVRLGTFSSRYGFYPETIVFTPELVDTRRNSSDISRRDSPAKVQRPHVLHGESGRIIRPKRLSEKYSPFTRQSAVSATLDRILNLVEATM